MLTFTDDPLRPQPSPPPAPQEKRTFPEKVRATKPEWLVRNVKLTNRYVSLEQSKPHKKTTTHKV